MIFRLFIDPISFYWHIDTPYTYWFFKTFSLPFLHFDWPNKSPTRGVSVASEIQFSPEINDPILNNWRTKSNDVLDQSELVVEWEISWRREVLRGRYASRRKKSIYRRRRRVMILNRNNKLIELHLCDKSKQVEIMCQARLSIKNDKSSYDHCCTSYAMNSNKGVFDWWRHWRPPVRKLIRSSTLVIWLAGQQWLFEVWSNRRGKERIHNAALYLSLFLSLSRLPFFSSTLCTDEQ